jgi:hypothetical protein
MKVRSYTEGFVKTMEFRRWTVGWKCRLRNIVLSGRKGTMDSQNKNLISKMVNTIIE